MDGAASLVTVTAPVVPLTWTRLEWIPIQAWSVPSMAIGVYMQAARRR